MNARTAALPALTALLTACGGSAPTPTYTLSVNVPAHLEVGESTQLAFTVRNSQGEPVTGQAVTWTSSDPQMVSVTAAGQATARHLSLSRKKVTLTARLASGAAASADVNTYGIDVALGVHRDFLGGAERLSLAVSPVRFQRMDGTGLSADATCTYTGPVGAPLPPVCLVRAAPPGSAGYAYVPSAPAQAGTYGVTFTLDGQTYTRTQVIDPAQALPFVQNLKVTVSGATLGATGTTVSAVKLADVFLYSDAGTKVFSSRVAASANLNVTTPVAGGSPVPPGTYHTIVTTYATLPPGGQDVLPDNLNFTDTFGPDVTVP
ncbi:hypothetical protein [Deinococcus radiotolerans]|uniref:BIG2 domain-containing protein n=1 Tax=Deinococcus radiotolerans TaxID=1309407 RepID=A0ABQ2FNR1_9DEIO|nr:hypothetical protein [Deinococcus radiotolerans]GGL12259.1 hypothetical protein GCM10010844_33620 [Deinococcus radiotolerans]